jgi:hypothetical protein
MLYALKSKKSGLYFRKVYGIFDGKFTRHYVDDVSEDKTNDISFFPSSILSMEHKLGDPWCYLKNHKPSQVDLVSQYHFNQSKLLLD